MGHTTATLNKPRVTTSNGFKMMNKWAVDNEMNRAANQSVMALIDERFSLTSGLFGMLKPISMMKQRSMQW